MEADYTIMTKEELTRRIDYDKQLLLLPTMYDKMNEMVVQDRIACENELKNRKNLKFHLIEGEYLTESDYEEFKNYYLHPEQITLAEIMTRLNLTSSQTRTLRLQVGHETGLKRSTSSRKLIPVSMKCGVHPKKYLEKYPEFKELYFNNEYNSLKIRKELEISRYAYDQLQRKVTKETGYIKRNQWGMDKK